MIPDEKSLIDDAEATALRYHDETSGNYIVFRVMSPMLEKPVEMPNALFQPCVSLSEKPRHRERHQTRAEQIYIYWLRFSMRKIDNF